MTMLKNDIVKQHLQRTGHREPLRIITVRKQGYIFARFVVRSI
jgi:DNA-binding winged helix-turn-helix (wHTH) protein